MIGWRVVPILDDPEIEYFSCTPQAVLGVLKLMQVPSCIKIATVCTCIHVACYSAIRAPPSLPAEVESNYATVMIGVEV